MTHICDATIMTSQLRNNFQLFTLGKITTNYYTSVTCYYVILVINLLNVKVNEYDNTN